MTMDADGTRARIAAIDGPIVVAASGGADSTALSELAHEAAPGRVRLVHVEHGWSDAGPALRAQVEAHASILGVPVVVVPLGSLPARQGVEGAARAARYEALAAVADGATILTGHTADDDIETVLFRLARGTGVAGLRGAQPEGVVGSARVVRPMLAWTRRGVRDWLTSRGLTWREDPTNADVTRARNRVRRDIVPALCEVGAADSLVRSVRQIGRDARVLDGLVARALDAATIASGDELRVLDVCGLAQANEELAAAILHAATRAVGAHGVDQAGVARLARLVHGRPGSCVRARQLRAERGFRELRLQRQPNPRERLDWGIDGFAPLQLDAPSRFGEWSLTRAGEQPADHVVDPHVVKGQLTLRRVRDDEPFEAWRTGRVRSAGEWSAAVARAPWRRHHLIGLCDEAGPLWLLGVRRGARAALPLDASGVRLQVEKRHSFLAFLPDPPTLRR